jgi:hypothetical protein
MSRKVLRFVRLLVGVAIGQATSTAWAGDQKPDAGDPWKGSPVDAAACRRARESAGKAWATVSKDADVASDGMNGTSTLVTRKAADSAVLMVVALWAAVDSQEGTDTVGKAIEMAGEFVRNEPSTSVISGDISHAIDANFATSVICHQKLSYHLSPAALKVLAAAKAVRSRN